MLMVRSVSGTEMLLRARIYIQEHQNRDPIAQTEHGWSISYGWSGVVEQWLRECIDYRMTNVNMSSDQLRMRSLRSEEVACVLEAVNDILGSDEVERSDSAEKTEMILHGETCGTHADNLIFLLSQTRTPHSPSACAKTTTSPTHLSRFHDEGKPLSLHQWQHSAYNSTHREHSALNVIR